MTITRPLTRPLTSPIARAITDSRGGGTSPWPPAPFLLEFDFTVGLNDYWPTWIGLWWENSEGENLYVAGSATPPLAAPLFYVDIGSRDGGPFVSIDAAPGSLPTTGDETPAATITITQAGVVVVEITLYGASDGSYLTTFDTVPAYTFNTSLTYHATIVALP